jgi:hypothetical protein
MEIWKPVVGFEGRYEVSSLGRVKALSRTIHYKDGRIGKLNERLIRGSIMSNGYIAVSFDSKVKKTIHQVVAEAFLGKTEYKMTVNHKDGNKLNNKLENLEWNTYKQNNDHARTTGLNKQHGVNCNLAKHSDQFIDAVRNVYAKYNPSYAELGKMFGLTGCHARQIVLYETRKKPTSLGLP